MKIKKILLLAILIYGLNTFGQYKYTLIYLKNDSIIKIDAPRRFKYKNRKAAVFYRTKDRKKVKIDVDKIERITVVNQKDKNPKYSYPDHTYKFKLIDGSIEQVMLVAEGKLNLYWILVSVNLSRNISEENADYYIEKEEGQLLYFTSTGTRKNKFIRQAETFLSSCEILMDKIKKGELKCEDVEEIVDFFNNKCH